MKFAKLSVEEIEQLYGKEFFENEEIKKLSNWTQPNSSHKIDEGEILENAEKLISEFEEFVDTTLETI